MNEYKDHVEAYMKDWCKGCGPLNLFSDQYCVEEPYPGDHIKHLGRYMGQNEAGKPTAPPFSVTKMREKYPWATNNI